MDDAQSASLDTRGVIVTVVWCNDEMLELEIQAGNGRFSGRARGYTSLDAAREFADALRGFPKSGQDRRSFEIGKVDDLPHGGGARFELRCRTSAGQAVMAVRLRADPPDSGAAQFSINIEAAGIDAFVSELERLQVRVGASATLPSADKEASWTG